MGVSGWWLTIDLCAKFDLPDDCSVTRSGREMECAWPLQSAPGNCPYKNKHPMPDSGIYVVTLSNLHPISVNAQNRKIADLCIKVTAANCKIGRANNFSARERNYWRTFGKQNVLFRPIALMPDPQMAERVILAALKEWRIRGRTGRLTEWLLGIPAADAEQRAIDAMRSVQIRYLTLTLA